MLPVSPMIVGFGLGSSSAPVKYAYARRQRSGAEPRRLACHSIALKYRENERRWVLSGMVDRVPADLVGIVVMRPEHVCEGGIAIDQFEPHATALLEAVRHGLDANIEAVDFSGLDR
jgi:predicted N-formylglutamate amidohydrolase